MIIRYQGCTLVRAGRHIIVVSDRGVEMFEVSTWAEAIHFIESRDHEQGQGVDAAGTEAAGIDGERQGPRAAYCP
jgi:hypothetical protein